VYNTLVIVFSKQDVSLYKLCNSLIYVKSFDSMIVCLACYRFTQKQMKLLDTNRPLSFKSSPSKNARSNIYIHIYILNSKYVKEVTERIHVLYMFIALSSHRPDDWRNSFPVANQLQDCPKKSCPASM
jgi:hypothetical protein